MGEADYLRSRDAMRLASGVPWSIPITLGVAQAEAGALVGQSDHGVSLSLYAKDPDGLEFEIFWTVPGGASVGTRPLDLEAEVARWSAQGV